MYLLKITTAGVIWVMNLTFHLNKTNNHIPSLSSFDLKCLGSLKVYPRHAVILTYKIYFKMRVMLGRGLNYSHLQAGASSHVPSN